MRNLFSGKVYRGAPGGCSTPDRDFPLLVRWFQQGKMPLDRLVTRRYSLEQINEACDALARWADRRESDRRVLTRLFEWRRPSPERRDETKRGLAHAPLDEVRPGRLQPVEHVVFTDEAELGGVGRVDDHRRHLAGLSGDVLGADCHPGRLAGKLVQDIHRDRRRRRRR